MTDYSSEALRVLQGLAVLFFVMVGLPVLLNRARLRRAAIAAYLLALVLALVLIARWLAGQ